LLLTIRKRRDILETSKEMTCELSGRRVRIRNWKGFIVERTQDEQA
jgi:hypothetical protein